jgi:DNA-binding IclR family transcriptional regulator
MFQPVRYVRDHLPEAVDATAFTVALTIASYTDRNGLADVGVRKLAATTRLNTQTIVRAIRRLEEHGVIAVDRHDRARSRYRFPVATTLSTAVLTEQTDGVEAAVLPERAACLNSADTLDFSGDNKTHARDREKRGERFLPGTGWVPAYQGVANQ